MENYTIWRLTMYIVYSKKVNFILSSVLDKKKVTIIDKVDIEHNKKFKQIYKVVKVKYHILVWIKITY